MRLNLHNEKQRLTKKPIAIEGPKPSDVFASTAVSTFTFAIVSAVTGLDIRVQHFWLTVVILALFIVFIAGLMLGTYKRYQQEKTTRAWLVTTVCAAAGLAFGWWLGDMLWFGFGIRHHQYDMMASYVNVDPMVDKGTSYMDAGTVYFKESSVPATAYAVAFQNGLRYCAAPILRETHQIGNLYELPQTGSADFWVVGTNCCGESGDSFTCHDVGHQKARTGIRVLDVSERDGYLLAVQQWASKVAVPVRHPLFFYWVKDPLEFRESISNTAWRDYQESVTIWAFVLLPVSFLLNLLLGKVFSLS